MTNPTNKGYLKDPYLQEQYLSARIEDNFGVQTKLIIDKQKAMAFQARLFIDGQKPVGFQNLLEIVDRPKSIGKQILLNMIKNSPIASQIENIINANKNMANQVEMVILKDHALGFQVYLQAKVLNTNGVQTTNFIVDSLEFIGVQEQSIVQSTKPLGYQVENHIDNANKSSGSQTKLHIKDHEQSEAIQTQLKIQGFDVFGTQMTAVMHKENDFSFQNKLYLENKYKATGYQCRMDKSFPHQECYGRGYLVEDYLTTPYLAPGYCVSGPFEVEFIMKKEPDFGAQTQLVVKAWIQLAMQIQQQIADRLHAVGYQYLTYGGTRVGFQFTAVLYNNYNLRCLYTFPSRGTDGINWTASSTETGDFDANNLNTDIVEQRWQSNLGDKNVTLTCDTQIPQGCAIDTLAILSHNISSSATCILEGSSDNFLTVGVTISLDVKRDEDVYYIAPTFPDTYWRYWRISINDATNPDNFIRVGTILFGTSTIMQGETFVDTLTRRKTHFSDTVRTEGFTSISNDRALKKSVNVNFQRLSYTRGNYKNLQYIIDYARTSLKCLWIPDATDPARFAVFGKLKEMPEESHQKIGTDSDWVDFQIEVDEAL
jgi:hypothetical protein